MQSCRFRSMAGAAWKLICFARRRDIAIELGRQASTWATLTPTGEIVARMLCLQENGYLVLRFLAEDVGKCLDQVLDAILRALSHQDART